MSYRFRENDELYRGSSEVRNTPDVSTTFQQLNLTGSYRPNPYLVLQATLPFTEAKREENETPDAEFSGLGDAQISAIISPWAKHTNGLQGIGFAVGVILPTGEPSDQPQIGLAIPEVFQRGTGTSQLILGTRYDYSIDDWLLFASVNATLPLDESSDRYRPAKTLSWRAGAVHTINEKFSTGLALEIFHSERDRFQGNLLDNTGSETISLTPSVSYRLNDKVSLSGSISIPLYRDVNATQLVAGPLYSLGASFSF